MKVYEFSTKVKPDGSLELPDALVEQLPEDQALRVLIMVDEPTDDEDKAWSRFAAEQLLAQYDDADEIYDRI